MNLLLTLSSLFFSAAIFAAPLTNIVVFGDSLSDNGNLYEYMQHRLPQSPPYFAGRFSNGPVWVEELAESYYPGNGAAHLLDYAFGGAGISVDDSSDDSLFTLKHEVEAYLLAHNEKADSQSLFIIWIGANNYLAIPDNGDVVVTKVNEAITKEMEKLANAGAQHIMVLNLPDLGRSPAADEFDAAAVLSSLANMHNSALNQAVKNLENKYPEVNWYYFDVNDTFNKIMDKPEEFGFNNITGTCNEVSIDKPSHNTVLRMSIKLKEGEIPKTCDGYLFFDMVHPTNPAHKLLSAKAKSILDEAGVEFK